MTAKASLRTTVPQRSRETAPATKPASQKKSQTVPIEDIETQEKLWEILDNGGTVVTYRGFHESQNPTLGNEWTQTHGDGLKHMQAANQGKRRASKDTSESFAEEMRREEFPDTPSRLQGIFLAATDVGAKEYGIIHQVKLCLKQGAAAAKAVRWLSIADWNQFGQQLATEQMMANLPKELMLGFEEEDVGPTAKDLARAYFQSRGENVPYNSEILVNPALASVTIGEEVTNVQGLYDDID